MKLLILGASNLQLNAIRRAKAAGHTVIVSDYYPDPPGKAYADYHEQVSTFDAEGNIAVAAKHGVDGVMTLGTDQPVLTVARVAEALRLPALIDVPTALAVTHKKVMKQRFRDTGIPTVNYRLLREDFRDRELEGLGFPVVVKPLDSQGQRGVYKLESIAAIREVFREVLAFSRESEILVEEYYPSDEITVSGWVSAGETRLIAVVDRISLVRERHIGICIAHRFPSRHLPARYPEILDLSRRIVAAFSIGDGPIYFQMLIGGDGIKINEIACRIGGAYEDIYLERATGIDPLGMLIEASLGGTPDCRALRDFQLLQCPKQLSVELFFSDPCQVAALTDIDRLSRLPGVVRAGYNLKPGDRVGAIVNATGRAGFMIIEGESDRELRERIERAYGELAIYDNSGINRLRRFQ
jgi:biotin carboxylase